MFTGTLAMLHRALRLDARLLRTHLFRLGFAGAVYVSLVVAWVGTSGSLTGAPGLKLFETMTLLNLVLISLAGVSFFATAITEEKDEDTLGLLMLAGIDPLGILLGKSTSRLVGVILLLLVQFPNTLLAITLGGVTLLQVVAAYCSLAAYMVLLANVGLLCSAGCRRGGNASAMTLLILIVYFVLPFGVESIRLGLVNGGVIPSTGPVSGWLQAASQACADASIWARLREIVQTGFAGHAVGFQVLVSLGLGAFCFLATWLGFHRLTGKGQTSAQRVDFASRFIGSWRRRRSRPGKRPVAWKEFHFVAGGMPVQIAKFVTYGAIAGAVFWAAERYYAYPFSEAGKFVALAMLGALVLESGLYASAIFRDEWVGRTLPLLAMLPIRATTVISLKIVGCLPALLPALFWLLVGCLIWPDGPEQIVKSLFLPSRWFYVLVLVLFLTLTVFFSMVVRWGALAAAIGVMVIGTACSGTCGLPIVGFLAQSGSDSWASEGGFLLIDAVIATLIVGLQFDVRRRLEIASSQ